MGKRPGGLGDAVTGTRTSNTGRAAGGGDTEMTTAAVGSGMAGRTALPKDPIRTSAISNGATPFYTPDAPWEFDQEYPARYFHGYGRHPHEQVGPRTGLKSNIDAEPG